MARHVRTFALALVATIAAAAALALIALGVGANPAAAQADNSPTINLSKSDGVIDGEAVTAELTGFAPEASLVVGICSVSVLETFSLTDCDQRSFGAGTADRFGKLTVTFNIFVLVDHEGVDCTLAGQCLVGAANGLDFLSGADDLAIASQPIRFEAASLPPDLAIAATIHDVTPWAIAGTVTCTASAPVKMSAHLGPTSDPNGRYDDALRNPLPAAQGSAVVDCDASADFVIVLDERTGRLRAGDTPYSLDLTASTDRDEASTSLSGTARLAAKSTLAEPVSRSTKAANRTRIANVRLAVRNGEVHARVRIRCGDASADRVTVLVRQPTWGAAAVATGRQGYRVCFGSRVVWVPLQAEGGILMPGAATVIVNAAGAAKAAPAAVPQRMVDPWLVVDTPPEPSADLTITAVRRRSIEVTMQCGDETSDTIIATAEVAWRRGLLVGRTNEQGGGSHNVLTVSCRAPGPTQVTIPLRQRINARWATVHLRVDKTRIEGAYRVE